MIFFKKISGHYFEAGESILNLLHGGQHLALKKYLDQALAGNDVQYEMEFLKDGQQLWLECIYKPLQNEYGINGVCALFRDITFTKEAEQTKRKKKEAEEKYFRSKALFEAFMENTPLTAWITDEKRCNALPE